MRMRQPAPACRTVRRKPREQNDTVLMMLGDNLGFRWMTMTAGRLSLTPDGRIGC